MRDLLHAMFNFEYLEGWYEDHDDKGSFLVYYQNDKPIAIMRRK